MTNEHKQSSIDDAAENEYSHLHQLEVAARRYATAVMACPTGYEQQVDTMTNEAIKLLVLAGFVNAGLTTLETCMVGSAKRRTSWSGACDRVTQLLTSVIIPDLSTAIALVATLGSREAAVAAVEEAETAQMISQLDDHLKTGKTVLQ